MAFDKPTRNRLASFVSEARTLITDEFRQQFHSIYGISETGTITPLDQLRDLDDAGLSTATLLRERVEYLASTHPDDKDGAKAAVDRLAREQAFTVLNRLAAVRMAEKRDLVVEAVGKGYQSKGFKVFEQMAGAALGDTYQRYRRYLYCLFDELAVDLGVLFDRRSPQGLLFPREPALLELLKLLNAPDLETLWVEDETIGWIYQYYNDPAERKKMRDESAAPRNSRELAVRNQFFTPRYVVEFLTDNTVGRIWYEMTQGQTQLKEQCRYLVRRPTEIFLKPEETAPETPPQDGLNQEELLKQPVYIAHRPLKDPRDIRMLDPACGSMHFGLYAFDLFESMYAEAWDLQVAALEGGGSCPRLPDGSLDPRAAEQILRSVGWVYDRDSAFRPLPTAFPSREAFLREVPRLIIEHNIHGIDIDPRATQIAGLSLWLRSQRAWQQQRVRPQDRPRIRRSNIVCAEPMPGDEALLNEFITARLSATPEQKLLGQLVRRVFDAMKLAGEAGSLLKIEEEIVDAVAEAKQQWLARPQMELYLDNIATTDKTFWEKAEQRIYTTLQTYAEQAENGGGYQRRLFADDAARGFAFIDLGRKRYDAVLMNPPFGQAPTILNVYIETHFSDSFYDLYAAFVERGSTFLEDLGKLGAITNRTGFFLTLLRRWRKKLVSDEGNLHVFADLGAGVLDSALVETAAYIISQQQAEQSLTPAVFFRCIGAIEKERLLGEAIIDISKGLTSSSCFIRRVMDFSAVPGVPLCYWIDVDLLATFRRLPSFISGGEREAWMGLSTGDDFQWIRLWWEIEPRSITISRSDTLNGKPWAALAKGGEYSPFWSDIHLVVNWDQDGKRLSDWKSSELSLGRITANNAKCWNQSKYFRSGLTWSRRTTSPLSMRILPEGTIFGDKGPGLFCQYPELAVGIFHTELYGLLVELQLAAAESAARSYEIGLLSQTPFPSDPDLIRFGIAEATEEAIRMVRGLVQLSPTSREFLLPRLATKTDSLLREVEQFKGHLAGLNSQYEKVIGKLERAAAAIYKTNSIQKGDFIRPSEWEVATSLAIRISAADLVDYIAGVAVGRWDIRFATGERAAPELPDPFAPLPVCPPGQLQNEQGLPITKDDVERLQEEYQWKYPIEIPWDGILVDDPVHPLDIEARVQQVLQVLWQDRWEAIGHEACEILGVRSLRDYLRKPSGFFADHLKRYSKSRRQAPIYWPLSTASGSYTLWIYYHRLNENTLHTALADFIDPKLKSVRAEISLLRESKARRDRLEELLNLEQELEDFRAEIERIIKLPWKPNLNDGVLITASPLWKLFRLSKWQKDLKACWEELAKGDYDWAHLAYTIWPQRVEDVCKQDRSIAIAHGLEDLCKASAPKPKAKRGKKAAAPTFDRMAS